MTKKTEETENLSPEEALTKEITKLRLAVAQSNRQATFWYSFLRAAVAALGATIGVAIILSLVLWFLHAFSFVPGATAISNAIQQFNILHGGK